jgi:tetratricopeptide (TPR) repeat protein
MKIVHHINKISLVLAACFIVFYLSTEWTVFAGDSRGVLTVAIVPIDGSVAARKVADLAYPAFQSETGIRLVERAELDRVQRELALSAALASPAKRLQLGKTLGADFLILADVTDNGDGEADGDVSLRVVDCATGCVAASVNLPTKKSADLSELLKQTAEVFTVKMRWLATVSRSELQPISIPTFNSLSPGSLPDEQAAERLRKQLLVRLGNLPGVICLERDELARAWRELNEFKNEAAEFWGSAVIITGAVGLQGEGLRELFASLTLHVDSGAAVELDPVIGDTREFDELTEQLEARITDQMPGVQAGDESNGFDRKAEVALLTRLGTIYHLGGQYEKAQTVLENALALQPGEPTEKQRIQMAEVLQRLQPNKGGRSSPRNDLRKYLQWMENYIEMMERYVKPWKYKYPNNRIVRNDVTTFFMRPPHQIRRYIKLRQGNPSYVLPEKYERIFARREYLRELYREYVLANLASGNVANEFNPIVLYKNPDDIVTWYRNHWDIVLKQIAQSLAGQENEKSTGLFFSERNLRWHQRSGRDPLSENESERTYFIQSIVSPMRNFSAFKSSRYYILPFSNAASVIGELHQINRDAFDQLSALLSLSEAAKAFVLIGNTNLWNHLVGWPSRRSLATTPEEFIQALRTLADILDHHDGNGEPHWIISEGLSTKEYYNAASCILWATVHLLPQKRREALLKNWFIPKMTENPASALVNPLYSLMPTRRRLRDFVPGKHVDMPKNHELFRHPDANNPCFDLYACPELRDYFAGNQDTPSEETEFSIPLLEFYLTHRDKVNLDAQGKRILSETLELAKTHSPRAATMIARIERENHSDQENQTPVDRPSLVLDKSITTGKGLRFDEYDALIDAVVHGNRLWALWGSVDGFAFLELDLDSFAVLRSMPIELSKPDAKSYMAPHRMQNLNSVQWATTNDHVFIGHRDFILMEPSQLGVTPFATASIPANGKGLDKSVDKSLPACIRNATPKGNASGRMPVPKEAAKGISAFCGLDDRVYFANQGGIYCWNETENTLELLASCHMANGKSPLDGGTPYSVYWMGNDVDKNRVFLAVHETKNGNPRIWGGQFGERIGLWTYTPEKSEWKHMGQISLGAHGLPDSLSMTTNQKQVIFNSSQVAGRIPFASPFSLFYRSADGWKIGTHDPETQKWWQVHKPLPPPAFLDEEGMNEYKVIAHPYEDAWIFHQPLGGSNRKIIYATGKNAEKFEVLELRGLANAKYRGQIIHPYKVFPIPDGALIWYLCKNDRGEIAHKLIRWTPNAPSTSDASRGGIEE